MGVSGKHTGTGGGGTGRRVNNPSLPLPCMLTLSGGCGFVSRYRFFHKVNIKQSFNFSTTLNKMEPVKWPQALAVKLVSYFVTIYKPVFKGCHRERVQMFYMLSTIKYLLWKCCLTYSPNTTFVLQVAVLALNTDCRVLFLKNTLTC